MKAITALVLALATLTASSARAESPGRVILDGVVEKTGEHFFIAKMASEQACLVSALAMSVKYPATTGKTGAYFWCRAERGETLPPPEQMSTMWATGHSPTLFIGSFDAKLCDAVASMIRDQLPAEYALTCRAVPNS
jgi:hypothetical protein